MGQPVRHAALVHRAPPHRGRVLAGAGRRRDRVRPAAPSRLDPLPLAGPTTATPLIATATIGQPRSAVRRGGRHPSRSTCTSDVHVRRARPALAPVHLDLWLVVWGGPW